MDCKSFPAFSTILNFQHNSFFKKGAGNISTEKDLENTMIEANFFIFEILKLVRLGE